MSATFHSIDLSIHCAEKPVFPCYFFSEIQKFVYQLIDPNKRIYEEGWKTGKCSYRMFSFYLRDQLHYDRKSKMLSSKSNSLHLSIKTPHEGIAETSVKMKDSLTAIGGNRIEYIDIEVKSVPVSRVRDSMSGIVTVLTVSPVLLKKMEGKKTVFPRFKSLKEMSEVLEDNLRAKYNALRGKPYRGAVNVVPSVKRKKHIIPVKFGDNVFFFVSYSSYYVLDGGDDILAIALGSGLGHLNGCGFGCLEPVSEVGRNQGESQ